MSVYTSQLARKYVTKTRELYINVYNAYKITNRLQEFLKTF